ncbi:hypothetical protein RQP46_001016 [Phenoliferia psychrophenolica]
MSFSGQESTYATSYNARGFEARADPFDALVGGGELPLGMYTKRHSTTTHGTTPVGTNSRTFRVVGGDGLFVRLGAKSAAFGGWDGDRRVEEWSTRWGGGAKQDTSDESDGEDDDEPRGQRWADHDATRRESPRTHAGRGAAGNEAGPKRTQSSLSVFHDSFEEQDDDVLSSPRSTMSYFTSPSTSPTMSRAHSRHSSIATRSPHSTSLPLPLSSPALSTPDFSDSRDDESMDDLTHSFLIAQQDSLGLFARVESWLEWPWASSTTTKDSPTAKSYRSSPMSMSRVSSTNSLVGSTAPPSPSLEHSLWSESGELSAYRRARSMADLASKLEWEDEEREGHTAADDSEPAPQREGLAAFVDVLAGLGGFL